MRKSSFPSDRIRPVWDLGQGRATRALVAALLIVFLLAGACSGDDRGGGSGRTAGDTGSEEGTLVSSTTDGERTDVTSPPEATLGVEPDSPDVVLRLEGDPKTTFSGICTVGGRENVLSGRVPKRYTFDPKGEKLSCRIQKQDPGKGRLKVILTANDTTRSVQQTNTRGGLINISYQGA
jgi:hypothetical protein